VPKPSRGVEETFLVKFMHPSMKKLLALAFSVGMVLCIESLALAISGEKEQRKFDQLWPCHDDFPIARDANNKPIVLSMEEALKRVIHCEKPFMPALARSARLQGTVIVQIAVDSDGKARCLRLISGHPLCSQSAIDAARQWTFRPMKKVNTNIGFLTQLAFQFSTGDMSKLPGPDCTKARWK
jgi:TonB family protein